MTAAVTSTRKTAIDARVVVRVRVVGRGRMVVRVSGRVEVVGSLSKESIFIVHSRA